MELLAAVAAFLHEERLPGRCPKQMLIRGLQCLNLLPCSLLGKSHSWVAGRETLAMVVVVVVVGVVWVVVDVVVGGGGGGGSDRLPGTHCRNHNHHHHPLPPPPPPYIPTLSSGQAVEHALNV